MADLLLLAAATLTLLGAAALALLTIMVRGQNLGAGTLGVSGATTNSAHAGPLARQPPEETAAGLSEMLGATPKQHPLAAKMRMAHHRIERNMKCDNRSVRKRNQKEVATMMTGIKATAYAAFNLAELHYHGAPGIAPDMKLTLHLYVCTMEAEDAAQTFAGARDFLNHYVFNLMGILDQCSLEAVEPVAARLDDACYVHNQTSDWPAEFKLAAAWGRGRFAYLQGRAEDATKEWETVATMSGQLQHRPMLHTYVGKAEYHMAKLKAEQADDTAALAAAETILEKSQDQLKQIHPGFAPKQPSSSSAPPLVMELSGPDGDKTPVKITSAEEMAERIDKMKMLGMS